MQLQAHQVQYCEFLEVVYISEDSDFVSDLISPNFQKDVLYSRGERIYTDLDL